MCVLPIVWLSPHIWSQADFNRNQIDFSQSFVCVFFLFYFDSFLYSIDWRKQSKYTSFSHICKVVAGQVILILIPIILCAQFVLKCFVNAAYPKRPTNNHKNNLTKFFLRKTNKLFWNHLPACNKKNMKCLAANITWDVKSPTRKKSNKIVETVKLICLWKSKNVVIRF